MTVKSRARTSRADSSWGAGELLACRGVHKSFESTKALAGVQMGIRGGEILAITGESGSGKSTLLLCLAGLLIPEMGEVSYKGDIVSHLSDDERTELRRREFGFIFQLGHLVPDLPCLENVALPLMLGGVARREAQERAAGLLERFGVEDLRDRMPGEISGGEAQRVAVARAFVADPQVIFADEPTGSLDSRNGTMVMDMLVSAAREQGSAIVLVTHSETVATVADSRIVMRDGRRTDMPS